MSNLLLDEHPLIILPRLALEIGLNEAIVVQQVHFLTQPGKPGAKALEGFRYVRLTLPEWQQEHFIFWSEPTVKRVFSKCKKAGYLRATDKLNAASADRTLWYAVGTIPKYESVRPMDQSDPVEGINLIPPRGDQSDPVIREEEETKTLEGVVRSTNPDYGRDHWAFKCAQQFGKAMFSEGTLTIQDQELVDSGELDQLAQVWSKDFDALHTGVPNAPVDEIVQLVGWLTTSKDGRWWLQSAALQSPRKLKRIRYRDEDGKKVNTKTHWFTYLKQRARIGRRVQIANPIDAAIAEATGGV